VKRVEPPSLDHRLGVLGQSDVSNRETVDEREVTPSNGARLSEKNWTRYKNRKAVCGAFPGKKLGRDCRGSERPFAKLDAGDQRRRSERLRGDSGVAEVSKKENAGKVCCVTNAKKGGPEREVSGRQSLFCIPD